MKAHAKMNNHHCILLAGYKILLAFGLSREQKVFCLKLLIPDIPFEYAVGIALVLEKVES